MTKDQADEFKDGLTRWMGFAKDFHTYGSAGCGVSGALCLVAGGFMWRGKRKNRSSDELQEPLADSHTAQAATEP